MLRAASVRVVAQAVNQGTEDAGRGVEANVVHGAISCDRLRMSKMSS